MRIATWNINGLRARLDFVMHWLESRQPDVVGLQELKVPEELFPYEQFKDLGYSASVHGQKAWNGVAVLTRREAEVRQVGLPGQDELGARLIAVDTEQLSFITVYCPNGKHTEHSDFSLKLAWFESLRNYLDESHLPDSPVVLCGDFNICPGALDSWNEKGSSGKIFHTDEERSRFQSLLDWGLVDIYRQQNPETKAYSWWDYRAGAFHRNLGLRIDFLLATTPVLAKVRGVQIDREYRKKKDGLTASDHAPVFADLG